MMGWKSQSWRKSKNKNLYRITFYYFIIWLSCMFHINSPYHNFAEDEEQPRSLKKSTFDPLLMIA